MVTFLVAITWSTICWHLEFSLLAFQSHLWLRVITWWSGWQRNQSFERMFRSRKLQDWRGRENEMPNKLQGLALYFAAHSKMKFMVRCLRGSNFDYKNAVALTINKGHDNLRTLFLFSLFIIIWEGSLIWEEGGYLVEWKKEEGWKEVHMEYKRTFRRKSIQTTEKVLQNGLMQTNGSYSALFNPLKSFPLSLHLLHSSLQPSYSTINSFHTSNDHQLIVNCSSRWK